MGILSLPNELLLLIADDLLVKDLASFLSANRRLSTLLTPYLQKIALQDVGRCPALLWAVIYGHAPLAELVISKGAKVNTLCSEDDGQTPLHVAAELDHPDVIRVLVKRGARIDAKNRDLHTPLHRAVYCGSPLAVRVLLELGADVTCTDRLRDSPAYAASRLGNIDGLRPFLDAGLDFNDRDVEGRTILHVAVRRGILGGGFSSDRGLGMVGFLLDNGGVGIINAQDSSGGTPLHVAGVHVFPPKKVIRLLLRYGADPEVKDVAGRKPNLRHDPP